MNAKAQPANDRELVLERVLDAPVEKVWRCWSDPKLLQQWFAPKPWTITAVDMDLRPGGRSNTVMRSPEGQEFPNAGVILEVVPERRIVMTDAFTADWQPVDGTPFFVAIVSFEPAPGGGTKYTAVARHWTRENREKHEQMGFHDGWGQCADQLGELAKSL